MKHHHRLHRITLGLALLALAILAGCGGGGDNTPAAVEPSGYYDAGSASVKQDDNATDLLISDLRAMHHGNRLMVMSLNSKILYDATITLNGGSYTGEAIIYREGARITPTPVAITGTYIEGSKITGTLTGTGAGNGTFEVTYALSNSQEASLERVVNPVERSYWGGAFYQHSAADTGTLFKVVIGGGVEHIDEASRGYFASCGVAGGSMLPITSSSLYQLTITFSTCDEVARDSSYRGLVMNLSPSATPVVGDLLLVAFSDGNSAGFAEFIYKEY